MIEKEGRAARDVMAEILPAILRGFPGRSRCAGARAREARCAALGAPAARDPLHVRRPARGAGGRALRGDGIAAGDVTYGHRFLAPAAIRARRFEDYVDKLAKAKVVLDADRRKTIILADAQSLALAHGLELVEDEGLLEEVAGLVECRSR